MEFHCFLYLIKDIQIHTWNCNAMETKEKVTKQNNNWMEIEQHKNVVPYIHGQIAKSLFYEDGNVTFLLMPIVLYGFDHTLSYT